MNDSTLEIACVDRVCLASDHAHAIGAGTCAGKQANSKDNVFVAALKDDSHVGSRISIRDVACFVSTLSPREAIYTPIIAAILKAAQRAHIELGDTLIVSGNSPIVGLIGLIGKWWAPRRILLTSESPTANSNEHYSHTVDVVDETAREQLSELLRGQSRTVFWDFSGNSSVWNLILNQSNKFARIISSASETDAMTIDFYQNVHRKGASIIGAPLAPEHVYDSSIVNNLSTYLKLAENLLRDSGFSDSVPHYLRG